jgi:hypothetical protein
MPYTFNGFGTKYYGRREAAEDGSYLTTLWITALYVPILPLGSYRVLPVGQGTNWVVHRSQSYQVLPVPLCWEQVWHIYMIGAPIFLAIGLFVWSGAKQDRTKELFYAQLNTAGVEIDTARLNTQNVSKPCLAWLNSPETPKKSIDTLRAELRERCNAWPGAEDSYIAKVDAYLRLVREGLSSNFVDDEDRRELSIAQSVWNIRRHEGEEAKQIAECVVNLSSDCYEGIFPVIDAIKIENKEACSELAALNQKCQ